MCIEIRLQIVNKLLIRKLIHVFLFLKIALPKIRNLKKTFISIDINSSKTNLKNKKADPTHIMFIVHIVTDSVAWKYWLWICYSPIHLCFSSDNFRSSLNDGSFNRKRHGIAERGPIHQISLLVCVLLWRSKTER